jgi:hypothetical protein
MLVRITAILVALAFCVLPGGMPRSAVLAQEPAYSYPFVLIAVGDDAPRADSVVTAAFQNSDGEILFSIVMKPQGTAWASNTTVRAGGAGMRIDPPIGGSAVTTAQVTLEQHPTGTEAYDNADILGVQLLLSQHDAPPDNLTCAAAADSAGTGYVIKGAGPSCTGVPFGQAVLDPPAALGMIQAAKCGNLDKPGKFVRLTNDFFSATVNVPSCSIIPPGAKQP